MVFVNLDKKQPKQLRGAPIKEYKCLNCGNVIDYPVGSIDARRFCSVRCKNEYLSPNL